jgi:hypothetical protein
VMHAQGADAAAFVERGVATHEIMRNAVRATSGTVRSNIAGVAQASEETGAAAPVPASASELSRQSEPLAADVAHIRETVQASRCGATARCSLNTSFAAAITGGAD